MSGEAPTRSRRASPRLVLHLSGRLLARTRGRSALIAAMIALPVIAMTAFGVVFSSMQATPKESLGYELGHAQAWVEPGGSGALRQDPADPGVATWGDGTFDEADTGDLSPFFPAGTDAIRIDKTQVTVTTATGIGTIWAVIGQSWNPALDGRYTVLSGRTPSTPGEVMATQSALDRMGIRVGQTATLTRPEAMSYTVVGVMSDAKVPSSNEELFVGQAPNAAADLGSLQLSDTPMYYLTGAAVTWPDIQKLNKHGALVLSRAVVEHPPVVHDAGVDRRRGEIATGRFWLASGVLLVGVFGLLQVALLAAAAFMVGARQQERTLAILSSIGADRRVVRAVVSLGGLLLGIVGSVIGVALGIGVGWVITLLTRNGSASQYPGFRVDPAITGAIVLLAIAFSWIAASIPAKSASRLDVVSALRGATRPVPPKKKTPVIGVLLILLGVALAVAGGIALGLFSSTGDPLKVVLMVGPIVLAPITILVGVIFVAPTLLRWVGGALSVLGVGSRLASRDAARNAARTVPAIAAVISTVFVAAFGTCLAASLQRTSDDTYSYATAMDQVSVSLVHTVTDAKNDTMTSTLDDPAPQVAALKSEFSLSTTRILSSAGPDLAAGPAKSGGLVAMPSVADRFRCPWDPRSPDYVAGRTYTNERMNSDPCNAQASYLGSYSTTGFDTKIMVGSTSDLALVLGKKVSAASRAALASGGAVSLFPAYLDASGRVTINWWTTNGDREYSDEKAARTTTLAAHLQTPEHENQFGIFISPETAAQLGIPVAPTMILGALSKPPTTAQKDAADAAITALSGDEYSSLHVETGPSDVSTPAILILLLISTVVSLAASAAAIGLARSDGRRDDAILGAVGAPPLLRRSFGFWQAVIIAGLGSAIGVLLGIAEFVALTIPKLTSSSGGLDFAAPIVPLLVVLVGIPLVISIGAWIGTRRGRTSVLDRSVIA